MGLRKLYSPPACPGGSDAGVPQISIREILTSTLVSGHYRDFFFLMLKSLCEVLSPKSCHTSTNIGNSFKKKKKDGGGAVSCLGYEQSSKAIKERK